MGTTPPHAQISSPPSLLQPVSWIQESPIEHWRSHRRLQNTTRLYSHELRWRHLVRFFPPRSSDVVLGGGWFLNDFWCLGLGDSDCFGRKLRATISRWPAAPMRCPRWKERISPCCNVSFPSRYEKHKKQKAGSLQTPSIMCERLDPKMVAPSRFTSCPSEQLNRQALLAVFVAVDNSLLEVHLPCLFRHKTFPCHEPRGHSSRSYHSHHGLCGCYRNLNRPWQKHLGVEHCS